MLFDLEPQKEYELYQTYERFKVYNVYIIDHKTNEKKFVYRETKPRSDYGKRLLTRQEMLNEFNKRLEVMNNATKSIEEQLL